MSESREAAGGPRRIVVIGIGNLYRGDDAVGRVVARRVSDSAPEGVEVIERDGGASELMDAFANAHAAIIVDAVHSGAEPGSVHRLDAVAESLPAGFFGYSTHGFGVAEAVELGRALGVLPPVVVVFGVEAAGFQPSEPGAGLSPEVEAAVDVVVAGVLKEVASRRGADDA